MQLDVLELIVGRPQWRMTELAQASRVDPSTMTRTIDRMTRNGLVERTVHPTVPPRVEYTLTEPGRALRATVDAMCDWTHRHLGAIESARHRFDERA